MSNGENNVFPNSLRRSNENTYTSIGFQRDPRSVINRPIVGNFITQTGFSQMNNAGTLMGATYRELCVIKQDAYDISLPYGNFAGSIVGTNDIIVRAGIEIPSGSGTFYPLFFNGNRDITLSPGGIATTDPLAVSVTTGMSVAVHTLVKVKTSGDKWPVGYTNVQYNNTTDDYTTATLPNNTFSPGYTPLSIIGNVDTEIFPSIALLGDSIAYGQGDSDGGGVQGFLYRAFNNFPLIRFARVSERIDQFLLNTAYPRRAAVNGVQYAIVEYGNNDLPTRTLTQIQNDLLSIWKSLKQRGIKVYQTTITPRTTSTDSWTTTTNQTPVTNFGANSNRTKLNDWIRTIPSGDLVGYIDIADVVETSRNSGIWNPAYITGSDGIHPNSAGHIAMANTINTGLFTV